MAKKPVSVKKQKMVTDIVVHVFLVIVAIVWLIPFIWIIAHSFRGESTGMFCSTFLPQLRDLHFLRAERCIQPVPCEVDHA